MDDADRDRSPGDVWSCGEHDFWVLSDGTVMMAVRRKREEANPLCEQQIELGNFVTLVLALVLGLGFLCDAAVIFAALRGAFR